MRFASLGSSNSFGVILKCMKAFLLFCYVIGVNSCISILSCYGHVQHTGFITIACSRPIFCSRRNNTVEAQTEMDIDWSDIDVNTAYLAADLQMMFGDKNDNQHKRKKKTVLGCKHEQKKKEAQSQGIDFEIKM